MSDEEMNSEASSNSEEVEMETEKVASKKSLPTYGKMLVEAIQEQQTKANDGISREKIVSYMKTKYHLEEVNANALKNAIKKAEENEIIEHKTGTGANGSFMITKKERAAQAKKVSDKEKADKKKEKAEKAKAEKPTEKAAEKAEKPKASEKTKAAKAEPKTKAKSDKKSKDDIDLKDLKKDVKKKPVPKGKENKETKEKATKKDDKPTTTTKKPALGKSKSHSAVSNVVLDDAIPSTSKQKKAVPAKRAKTAK